MSLSTILTQERTTLKGTCRIKGSFQFNTGSAPVNITGRDILSVAHTATGVWTITFRPHVNHARGVISLGAPGLELDASALTFLTFGAFSTANNTLIVRAYTEATGTLALADIAPGSNRGNWCHIDLTLKYGTEKQGDGIS